MLTLFFFILCFNELLKQGLITLLKKKIDIYKIYYRITMTGSINSKIKNASIKFNSFLFCLESNVKKNITYIQFNIPDITKLKSLKQLIFPSLFLTIPFIIAQV